MTEDDTLDILKHGKVRFSRILRIMNDTFGSSIVGCLVADYRDPFGDNADEQFDEMTDLLEKYGYTRNEFETGFSEVEEQDD